MHKSTAETENVHVVSAATVGMDNNVSSLNIIYFMHDDNSRRDRVHDDIGRP